MRNLLLVLILVAAAASVGAQRAAGALDMYLIDVEGGNATLLVAPSGESMLIDAGNGGAGAARDAGRILAAAADAGLKQIDYLVTTHYHGDHYGAMPDVAAKLPIRTYVDHGPNVQPAPATDGFLNGAYAELYGKAKRLIVKPGDRIDLGKVTSRIVSAAGNVLTSPLPGAGSANRVCAGHQPQAADPSENAASVGQHFTFGRFRAVHLGDLTWNKEFDLMCPANRLGEIDLFFVSHHGQPSSNAPVLVHALKPRVALMNNGVRKGGQPDAMKVLFSSPGLEDLWQVHFSQLGGQEYNVPGAFIANLVAEESAFTPPPAHNGQAYWIKVSARDDGSFTVINTRNGFSKTYAATARR